MNTKPTSPNERLMRILQASPEQLAAIDRVLEGTTEPARPERKGPFLLKMGDAASLMGVSRATLWRMLNLGRLTRVEILPATFRVRMRMRMRIRIRNHLNSSPASCIKVAR